MAKHTIPPSEIALGVFAELFWLMIKLTPAILLIAAIVFILAKG